MLSIQDKPSKCQLGVVLSALKSLQCDPITENTIRLVITRCSALLMLTPGTCFYTILQAKLAMFSSLTQLEEWVKTNSFVLIKAFFLV